MGRQRRRVAMMTTMTITTAARRGRTPIRHQPAATSSTSSYPLWPGRKKTSPQPCRTCVSVITERARRVAWLESPSCGQAWAGTLLGRPSGKPWPLIKVTCCTAWCATISPDGRPSCPGRENSCSGTWWTASSTERPMMAPGIFSVAQTYSPSMPGLGL